MKHSIYKKIRRFLPNWIRHKYFWMHDWADSAWLWEKFNKIMIENTKGKNTPKGEPIIRKFK